MWSRSLGGQGISIAIDQSANMLVTGIFVGTVDFGGGALTAAGTDDTFLVKYSSSGAHVWSKRFGSSDIYHSEGPSGVAVDANNNVALVGTVTMGTDFGCGALFGTTDAFVAKLSASGDCLWSKTR